MADPVNAPPESLLERIAAGDKAAVREALDRYGGLVWSLARKFTSDVVEAEDAVQEIFIELWRHAARFDASIAAETTFVAMIARRRLIDRRRRAARRPTPQVLPDQLPNPHNREGELVEVADEASQATLALQQLRPEQKKVLELSIYQGLTHEQIAAKTSMPLGTVKTHARRGLIKIREILGVARSGDSSKGGS